MGSVESNATDTISVKLPWQESQWSQILKIHADHRLPHALLFSGTAGVDKKRFAMALAHFLMCESPKVDVPCGQCRQCGFNKVSTHPDLKLIEPEERGKQIKVDQIRELVDFVSQTSQQGGYKIVILYPAESMNINAANALLKSLEEPSPKTLLLLLTDAPSQLLATIRSRCQSIQFPIPSSEQALQWLIPLVSSEEQAVSLLQAAAGQPMEALALLETDGISRFQTMSKDFLLMLNGRKTALPIAQAWLEYDLRETLMWLARRLTDVIKFRCADKVIAKEWQNVVQNVDVHRLFALVDNINDLYSQLSRGANPNHQLVLESLLLKSCDVFQES